MTTTGELRLWRRSMAAQGLSERTINERVRILSQISADTGLSPADISGEALETWLSRKRIARSSRASYLNAVRAFGHWAVDRSICAENPADMIPAPRVPKGRPRPLTDEQVHLAVTSARRRKMRAMVTLAAFEGLRVEEISRVRAEDFDWTDRSLSVLGKGDKRRVLPVHERLAAVAPSMARRGWWFPSPKEWSGHVSPSSVSAVMSRHLHRQGIHGSAHRLRHWFGSTLVREGVNLRTVQELMGHESPATTAIYTLVSQAQARDAISRLHLPNAPTAPSARQTGR